MSTVLGVDGCPRGWCAVSLDTSSRDLVARHYDSFAAVVATSAEVIAIDVPIGLMEGPGGRDCDREARSHLGSPRRSSVFSPPARGTLQLCDQKERYREACITNRETTGIMISRQSFWIGPKIREVDELMTRRLERRVYEAHPEVSFAALSGNAMVHRKSRSAGREERWRALRIGLPRSWRTTFETGPPVRPLRS